MGKSDTCHFFCPLSANISLSRNTTPGKGQITKHWNTLLSNSNLERKKDGYRAKECVALELRPDHRRPWTRMTASMQLLQNFTKSQTNQVRLVRDFSHNFNISGNSFQQREPKKTERILTISEFRKP